MYFFYNNNIVLGISVCDEGIGLNYEYFDLCFKFEWKFIIQMNRQKFHAYISLFEIFNTRNFKHKFIITSSFAIK